MVLVQAELKLLHSLTPDLMTALILWKTQLARRSPLMGLKEFLNYLYQRVKQMLWPVKEENYVYIFKLESNCCPACGGIA